MEKMNFNYRGVIAPVFTPFENTDKKELNLSLISPYAHYLAKHGVRGVLVNGTTGEGTSMSVAERKSLASAWAEAVKSTKQHLMVQIGGAPLPDVLELARHAEELKVDSILCLPELYFKPETSEKLIDYLKIVSQAAPNTPLLYYHIPMFTNVRISMPIFLESIENKIPSFAGIKFTSNDLEEGVRAFNVCNKKYVIFLGNDQLINDAAKLGMDSFIATSVNIFPERISTILQAVKAGNILKANQEQAIVTNAVLAIAKHGNWVETMKVAMAIRMNLGPVCPPLEVLPAKIATTITNDLTNILREGPTSKE